MSEPTTIDEAPATSPAAPTGQPLGEDEIRARAQGLPRWRRPRQLRRQLAWTLVLTALASVLLVGGLNFFAARDLLDTGTQDQLVDVGEARARSIGLGIERVRGSVSAVSGDLAIVAALEDLAAGFDDLTGEELTADQQAELDDFYQTRVVEPINELDLESVGIEPRTIDDYAPRTDAGRYLQYHYLVEPSLRGDDQRSVEDAGDGSTYSEAHAVHHPTLLAAQETFRGAGDVLLVTSDGDVVYSTDKRIDVGTNLQSGPYADTELGRVVTDVLPKARSGDAVYADIEVYVPAGARPVFFATAAVTSDTEVIGAIIVEIPGEALDRITTSEQGWEEVGLKSGESYVVGPDRVLRSQSRLWIEDPEEYLRRIEDEPVAGLVEDLGSPVGLQVVDTEPARSAIAGDDFSGQAENYLGTSTFSFSTPLALEGLDWVVVVDIPLSDARDPLYDYARRLGLVLLVILPAAALIGLWLARRLTRPIPAVLSTANEIVQGERDPDIPRLGHDEFGDLARRLASMAHDIGAREAELAEEYEQRRELLLAVLPPRVVEETGELAGTGELADVATAVAVAVDASGDRLDQDEDEQAEVLDEVATLANEAMATRTIERVRGAADGYLFLTGIGDPGDGVADALTFASELWGRFREYRAREELDISMRIGIATGPVATGVLDSGSLTFGAWGLPVRQALAVVALSQSGEILLDSSTATAAGDGFEIRPTTDVIDLDGRPMDLSVLDV